MTTQHTPGPWTANGDTVNTQKDCLYVARCAGDTDAQAAANAQLIAAAPELLAELIQLRANIEAEGWELKPSAAIAKAKGAA